MKESGPSAHGTSELPYLETLWNISTGALMLCDSRRAILSVNRRFTDLFGFTGEECAGADIDSLITPAPCIAESDSIFSLVTGGCPMAVTVVRKNASGELLRVFLTSSAVKGEKSGAGVLYIIKPVSPEAEKRQSDLMPDDKSLREAFENSCEPSCITDGNGGIIRVNSAFSAEFGWNNDTLPGRNVSDCLIPSAILPEAGYITAMATAGRTLRLETTRKHADGGETMISLITKPAPGGNVYRVFRTADSMALTEAALLKKNRFRGCPGTSRGMLFHCRTDRNRTMEFIAPGTAAFTGYSEGEILAGKTHYGSTIHELDREVVLKSIQDSLKHGNDYSITYRVRRDSGRVLWVMEQGRAFRAGKDCVDFCEGCIVDITGSMEKEEPESSARERIENLHAVASALQRSRSAGEIYRICSEAGLSILDGVCSCIFLKDGDRMKIVASAGREDYDCGPDCSLGMAEMAMHSSGPCYFRSRDSQERTCPAGTAGVCFKLGRNAVFQVISRSSRVFGNVDTRILELLLGYTEQGLKRLTLQHQLISQALHDPLTGIYNRNYFNRLIQLEEHRARRLDSAISFIMVDIDNFKRINDLFGHQTGDRVLQEVAGILEGVLRKTDTVLRYGGDEFLIILTKMTSDYTHIVEARINRALEGAKTPEGLKGERISVSMGHAFWTPGGNETIDDVLKTADMTMLKNKRKKSKTP